MTVTAVPLNLFNWKPPDLSHSDRIKLGREIARVGRTAFVNSLTKRLSATTNKEPFSYEDVLRDCEKLENATSMAIWTQEWKAASASKKATATIVVGGGLAVAAALAPAALAVVLPVSLGSLWWMQRRITRWAQSLVDDYSGAIARGNLPEASRSPD